MTKIIDPVEQQNIAENEKYVAALLRKDNEDFIVSVLRQRFDGVLTRGSVFHLRTNHHKVDTDENVEMSCLVTNLHDKNLLCIHLTEELTAAFPGAQNVPYRSIRVSERLKNKKSFEILLMAYDEHVPSLSRKQRIKAREAREQKKG